MFKGWIESYHRKRNKRYFTLCSNVNCLIYLVLMKVLLYDFPKETLLKYLDFNKRNSKTRICIKYSFLEFIALRTWVIVRFA